MQKDQASLKREAEKAMQIVNVDVSFDEQGVTIGKKRYTEWKLCWKELKKILSQGQKRHKQQTLAGKNLQSETPKQYSEEDFGWLKCNTDPRKTSSIFSTLTNTV